jgi:hypothetical protein
VSTTKATPTTRYGGRVVINTFLLSTAVLVFFTTLNLRQEMLSRPLVLLQLVLSIPVLLTSCLAYVKADSEASHDAWRTFAWLTFVLGYGFMLNVIGVMVATIGGTVFSVIFFCASVALAVAYSAVDIILKRSSLADRLPKDALFLVIQLGLGLLVALKVV